MKPGPSVYDPETHGFPRLLSRGWVETLSAGIALFVLLFPPAVEPGVG